MQRLYHGCLRARCPLRTHLSRLSPASCQSTSPTVRCHPSRPGARPEASCTKFRTPIQLALPEPLVPVPRPGCCDLRCAGDHTARPYLVRHPTRPRERPTSASISRVLVASQAGVGCVHAPLCASASRSGSMAIALHYANRRRKPGGWRAGYRFALPLRGQLRIAALSAPSRSAPRTPHSLA